MKSPPLSSGSAAPAGRRASGAPKGGIKISVDCGGGNRTGATQRFFSALEVLISFLKSKISNGRAFACTTELKRLQALGLQIVPALAFSLQLFPQLFSWPCGGEGGSNPWSFWPGTAWGPARAFPQNSETFFLTGGGGWGGGVGVGLELELELERRTEAMSISNDLRLEYWPLDRLIPSARNARTHSPAQVAEIAGSIRAFGFSSPVLYRFHS
jgi:hypothetical protein